MRLPWVEKSFLSLASLSPGLLPALPPPWVALTQLCLDVITSSTDVITSSTILDVDAALHHVQLWLDQLTVSTDRIVALDVRVSSSELNVSLQAERLELNASHLHLHGAEVLAGGTVIGRLESYTYPGQAADSSNVNLSLPVPLTVLHNTSSWHSLPAFVAEASAARWHEAHHWPNGSRRRGASS